MGSDGVAELTVCKESTLSLLVSRTRRPQRRVGEHRCADLRSDDHPASTRTAQVIRQGHLILFLVLLTAISGCAESGDLCVFDQEGGSDVGEVTVGCLSFRAKLASGSTAAGQLCNVCDSPERLEIDVAGPDRGFKSTYRAIVRGDLVWRSGVVATVANQEGRIGIFCSGRFAPSAEENVRTEMTTLRPGDALSTAVGLGWPLLDDCSPEAADCPPLVPEQLTLWWPEPSAKIRPLAQLCNGVLAEPGSLQERLDSLPLIPVAFDVSGEISEIQANP